MALLVLACAAGCEVTAWHVDHGLRAGSAHEAEVVRRVAAGLGAGFQSVRVSVAPGPNLEARAREARYAALPRGVLTGHTADDQAETVVLHLMRGATAGLAAIAPGTRRPLLALRRSDTVAVCAASGIEPVDDPSNRDPAIRRNRVRHELLHLMADIAGRDVVPVIARQAAVQRDDNDLLDQLAAALDPTDALAVRAAHPAVARRAVRRWLTVTHPPDLATVERVLRVAAGEVIGCDVGGGRSVRRTAQRLRLECQPAAGADEPGDLPHVAATPPLA